MGNDLVIQCEDCTNEADYIDVVGPRVAAPHCTSCMASELLDHEYDRGRIIAVDDWEEWQEDHPEVRLLTSPPSRHHPHLPQQPQRRLQIRQIVHVRLRRVYLRQRRQRFVDGHSLHHRILKGLMREIRLRPRR